MANETAIDTYEDLGYWCHDTGRFVPHIERLRVPAAYDAVLDIVADMLTEIGQVFQRPEQPVPTSGSKHRITLEMSNHASVYMRRGEERKQPGLIVELRDPGDGSCMISVACYWPLNYADETRQFLAGLKRYWPDIVPLPDLPAPGEAAQIDDGAGARRLMSQADQEKLVEGWLYSVKKINAIGRDQYALDNCVAPDTFGKWVTHYNKTKGSKKRI